LIKGRYLIKQNGVVIAESSNAITSEGLHLIRSYLANPTSNWAGAISVGAMNSTDASTTNTALDFELARFPVLLRSVESDEIVIKGVLNSDFSGKIFELGIYPEVSNTLSDGFDDALLLNFDELWLDSSDDLEINSSSISQDSRAGQNNLKISSPAAEIYTNLGLNLSGYTNFDIVSIMYNVTTTGLDRSFVVTFIDNQLPTPGTKYAEFTLDCSSTGYKKINKFVGDFVETGNFNSEVIKIEITIPSYSDAAEVELDALRINDADETNPDFALVSRSIIGVENGSSYSDYVYKPGGVEVDIEYRVKIL
jgi:hypothetical protein